MERKNGVNHSMQASAQSRRKNVIVRLETQLKVGLKTKGRITVVLTESDRNRINKEISVLKTRI